jgi:hypothetical protein
MTAISCDNNGSFIENRMVSRISMKWNIINVLFGITNKIPVPFSTISSSAIFEHSVSEITDTFQRENFVKHWY